MHIYSSEKFKIARRFNLLVSECRSIQRNEQSNSMVTISDTKTIHVYQKNLFDLIFRIYFKRIC